MARPAVCVSPILQDVVDRVISCLECLNLLARNPERFTSVIAGGAGVRSVRRNQAAVIEALETDDVSSITDPGALFTRQFAESRLTDPTSLAGRDNDLKALAAYSRGNTGVGYDPPSV